MAGIRECCKDCKERHSACHDYCEKYQKARAEYLEERRKIHCLTKGCAVCDFDKRSS